MKKSAFALALLGATAMFATVPAAAELAVAGIDGKQPRLGAPATDVKPDKAAVIDLASYPPKVVGMVDAPYSMIGPPTSVAMSRDGRIAVLTQSQRLDPADNTKFVLDGSVTVVDLADPTNPKVSQSLKVADGATGVAINRAGTLALVASTTGAVTVFSIANHKLTAIDTLKLNAEAGPCDVAFTPDGKTALVSQRRGNALWRLAVNGMKVTDTGVSYETGNQTYGTVFSNDSRYAYNTNLVGYPRPPGETRQGGGQGAGGPTMGTVTVIDLKTNKVVNRYDVGPTPEHIAMSPDGKFVEVTVVNGSSAAPTSANYNPFGLLQVYSVNGPNLTKVAEAHTGGWGQGAAWSDDGKTILLQGAIDKVIQVYRFDGKTLKEDPAAVLKFDGRPGAVTTGRAR